MCWNSQTTVFSEKSASPSEVLGNWERYNIHKQYVFDPERKKQQKVLISKTVATTPGTVLHKQEKPPTVPSQTNTAGAAIGICSKGLHQRSVPATYES